MPLQSIPKGASKATRADIIGSNIAEQESGPKFKQTATKHGKETAHKQAIAIALSEARKK